MAKMTKEQKQGFIREFPGNHFSGVGTRMNISPKVVFKELLGDEEFRKSCEESDRQCRERYKRFGYKIDDDFLTLSEQLKNWEQLKKR